MTVEIEAAEVDLSRIGKPSVLRGDQPGLRPGL